MSNEETTNVFGSTPPNLKNLIKFRGISRMYLKGMWLRKSNEKRPSVRLEKKRS